MPTWFWNPVPWALFGALITGWVAVLSLWQQAQDVRELKGWLIGGDSYGYLEPLFDRPTPGVNYFLRFSGDYPLYDVSVRVQDAEGRNLTPVQLFGTLTSNSQWYGVDGLFFPPPTSPNASEERRVEIIARNTVIVQRLRLRAEGGRWLTNSADIRRGARELMRPGDFPQEGLQ